RNHACFDACCADGRAQAEASSCDGARSHLQQVRPPAPYYTPLARSEGRRPSQQETSRRAPQRPEQPPLPRARPRRASAAPGKGQRRSLPVLRSFALVPHWKFEVTLAKLNAALSTLLEVTASWPSCTVSTIKAQGLTMP